MNELSVVIPCVSSVEALSQFVDKLAVHLMGNPSEIDVVIVVNESAGLTEDFVRGIKENYPWLRFEVLVRSGNKRNYGALARFGIAYSTSRYVVLVSPYGPDDISIIDQMLKKIRGGYQVVQAISESPRAESKAIGAAYGIYRSIYRWLARVLVGVEIRSATNTFKMFDRVFVQALGLTCNDHSVCTEITFKVLLAGGKLEYVASSAETAPINNDFRIYRDGVGYSWVLVRGFLHRAGVLWF
jgi:glycosyltransferase involved in cell wall biosynthesis